MVVFDKDKMLNEGVIEFWILMSFDFYLILLKCVCEVYKINMDKFFKKLIEC